MPAVFGLLSKLRQLEVLTISFNAALIGRLDVMTIPEGVGSPAQLKSVLVTQRRMSGPADDFIIHELQNTSESGWIAAQRDGTSRNDWIESSLRKLDLAYC
ncbi:hypothetical protein SISNIDRAFT_168064 [Sistotremastrum niveocremeum HHB9708]|uniref:Uncharacterized protein n=1 Tax=Sistotremastrum niveocremeum HHB9708 TaxID=1314777 RepID=A0A164SC93_9AGAM|nr:hypothetical protein SISNIDRAFT_168064 [Sistotremastrum niveocremeum HHB9708]